MASLLISCKYGETGNRFYTVTDGKKDLEISICSTFCTVLVKNAAHKVWRGCGKVLHKQAGNEATVNLLVRATELYKSAFAKSAIAAVIAEEAANPR